MKDHDQNQVEPEVLETKLGEDTTSKSTVEVTEQTEDASIAAPEVVTEPTEPEPEQETAAEEPVQTPEPPKPEEEPAPVKAAEPVPQPEAPKKELTADEKAHMEMLSMYEESFSNFKKGEIIEGTIVDISDKEVRVDIGFKSEGVIPISEFAYSGVPERNTVVRVFISEVENNEGKLLLSKKKADYNLNIERIKNAFADGGVLNGTIRRRVKGGMIVDVLGIEAFLPGSQMSLKPIPNLDQFIGKELSFKVVAIDEEHRNIILSRRDVLEEEARKKREELLGKLQIDSELDGEVKNITQYGAFIDLGGIDGLLHLTDMSWGKINHPSEMLQIGDKVKVKVINFDPETNKISLGLKQLVPHPWETIEIKYPEGTRITGKVTLGDRDIYAPGTDVTGIRSQVGMVFQKPNPFPKSIFNNVAYGLQVQDAVKNRSELADRVEASLQAAWLWDEVKNRLHSSAMSLSGGQQQRLCMARALATSPRVLLLDEPTSALDPQSTAKIEELCLELKNSVTILIVTHNVAQAGRISEYTAFMYLGELVEFGTTEKMFTVPADKRTEAYLTGVFG